jgi:hypothetical protein
MSINEKMATFKAEAVNEDGERYAVVYEQWAGYDAPHVHRASVPYADEEKALDTAFRLAQHLKEHYQSVINRELSKMQDWLNLSHEERVKRARDTFPVGSPFRKQDNDS